jgi:hypothetical protein
MCHVTKWMDEEGLEITRPRNPQKVYIRFGKFSKGHRSMNHATGQMEKGLSVYNARLEADDTVSLIADDWSLSLTAKDCGKRLQGRLAFVVTGEKIAQGSDGEPVLRRVRLLHHAIRHESLPAEVKEQPKD